MKGEPEIVAAAGAAAAIYRSAPSLDGLRTAAIGGFSCEDAAAGAALLRELMARLRGEGFGAALGPMDGNTWAKYRLVVESDGSVPFLMEPGNPDWYPAAFDAAGFEVVSRYVSSVRDATVGSKAPAAPGGVRLRAFDPAQAEAALGAIHGLSVGAFAKNAFYTPISRQGFVGSYLPVVPMLDPELVLLAEDEGGELVGFLFAIPGGCEGGEDETPTQPLPFRGRSSTGPVATRSLPLKGGGQVRVGVGETSNTRSVILKTYASLRKGVGSFLADTFHMRVREKGYGQVIHALMHEDNLSAAHSDKTGGRVFRRYALYGVRL